MKKDKNLENQKRFVQAKKAQGLKRLILWARPEDIEDLKLISRQPHMISKKRVEVEKKLEKELRPTVKAKVKADLERRTKRAMLTQKRAYARKQLASSNSPPSRIKFVDRIPSREIRNKLKSAGWLYDPVAVVWHLPTDIKQLPQVQRLLDELEPLGILKLSDAE